MVKAASPLWDVAMGDLAMDMHINMNGTWTESVCEKIKRRMEALLTL